MGMSATELDFEELHPGRWWRRDGDRFVCELCPRLCHLTPGQRAFCFVRVATSHGIALASYGRSSGFCIDPVEKKPLHHFHPGTAVFSFGTAGCNLGCKYCQNWDISKSREIDRLADRAGPVEIARTARALECESVAFTYNDPVIFAEYAIDVADACRSIGVHPIAVTAGYISAQARPEFFGAMDAANIDLKAFSEEFYQKQCLGHLAPVLETIEYVVHETKCWVELTTLVIPGLNDSERELHALAAWVREHLGPDVPLHFTAFHPAYKLMDRSPTPAATLRRARNIALQHGLHHVYVGNVIDEMGASTWCRECEALLIERKGYRITRYRLSENRCAACGAEIAGRFSLGPGHWGGLHLPIVMPAAAAILGGEHETGET